MSLMTLLRMRIESITTATMFRRLPAVWGSLSLRGPRGRKGALVTEYGWRTKILATQDDDQVVEAIGGGRVVGPGGPHR
jgi:hypothetical protein